MGRALADAAVGHGRAVTRDSLPLVGRPQVLDGLERPVVLVDGREPGDVGRARYVAAALRTFLRQIGRSEKLAAELRRRSHVDHGRRGLSPGDAEHVVAGGAGAEIGVARCVGGRLDAWHVGRQVAALAHPLDAPAVHDANVGVTVDLELPEGVGGEPVVVVAVDDDRRIRGNAGRSEQALDLLLVQDVAGHRVVQLGRPVPADGAGDVPLVVGLGVHVHLDEYDVVVVPVLRHPVGIHYRFRMRYLCSH